MTASDEAIEAMVAANTPTTTWQQLLAAIPPGVLARLAIERGGLREAFIPSPKLGPLYRVVDER